jgi:hypothetical protein
VPAGASAPGLTVDLLERHAGRVRSHGGNVCFFLFGIFEERVFDLGTAVTFVRIALDQLFRWQPIIYVKFRNQRIVFAFFLIIIVVVVGFVLLLNGALAAVVVLEHWQTKRT